MAKKGNTIHEIKELEAENGRLREALKEIAELANNEYWKRIPDPSCPKFMAIKRYAEKALKGAGGMSKGLEKSSPAWSCASSSRRGSLRILSWCGGNESAIFPIALV